mmetsp:Transcript_2504/g.5705  ORF Transcript_2504/g.5705 Transcript_2504/m.5705 type:complete len:245 (+) Transcript_2504:1843-2577(+)
MFALPDAFSCGRLWKGMVGRADGKLPSPLRAAAVPAPCCIPDHAAAADAAARRPFDGYRTKGEFSTLIFFSFFFLSTLFLTSAAAEGTAGGTDGGTAVGAVGAAFEVGTAEVLTALGRAAVVLPVGGAGPHEGALVCAVGRGGTCDGVGFFVERALAAATTGPGPGTFAVGTDGGATRTKLVAALPEGLGAAAAAFLFPPNADAAGVAHASGSFVVPHSCPFMLSAVGFLEASGAPFIFASVDI